MMSYLLCLAPMAACLASEPENGCIQQQILKFEITLLSLQFDLLIYFSGIENIHNDGPWKKMCPKT